MDPQNTLPNSGDADDYRTWLIRRRREIDSQPHWLELDQPAPEDHSEEPTAPRLVTARRGDSISRILGTSDPSMIGAFARANGLRPTVNSA
ncbi:MAG TPA: hypothetical protein VFN88_08945, partial [Caulobacteraceae bacterium]|nr:hypothetical protein [Caulobacteraceae bacterium]